MTLFTDDTEDPTNWAEIRVPTEIAENIIKFNGLELFGRPLEIQTINPLQNPPPPPAKKPTSEHRTEVPGATQVDGESIEYTTEQCIKFSPYLRPFDVPPYQVVALTAMKHFEQEGMLCHPIRVGGEIIYKFVLRDPVEKNGQTLEFMCGGQNHSIPMYCWEKPDRSQSEIKIRYFLLEVLLIKLALIKVFELRNISYKFLLPISID